LRLPLRVSATRFPAYLRDKSPPEFEDCTVARRWLRVAFLLPGAAALAAFLVELAVSGNLVANAGAIVINTVWYLIGVVAFLFAADNRAARRLLAATSLVVIGYAVGYGLTAHGNANWAVVILLQTLAWTFECSVLALFAVFPEGIYQRSYERRIVIAALVLQVPLQIIQLAGSNSLGQPIFAWTALRVPDPFFVIQLRSLGPVATALINDFGVLSIGGALALLILRYRRFGSQQRRQVRWPLYGVAAVVVWGVLSNLVPTSNGPPTLTDMILYLGPQVLLPMTLAIGIVNPRGLDVDLVIRRSLVYGVLWLLVAAAYVGVATAVGIALGQRVPLQLAILLTIAATLVFQPARQWLERLGDRLVFGRRLGGYQLISQLGAGLESSTATKDVAGTVAAVLQAGLGARWVRVDLNRPEPTPVALAGTEPGEGALAVLTAPLVHANQVVGRIDCGPKLEGAYVPADQELLTTLGRQAALSIRNSELTAELSDRLEELAASRMRLVQADDAARRRLERDLHDGVQQQLVGLLARLGLARNQLRRDPELATSTLRDASLDAQRALENVQELARGIHPAVLTDRGLVEAVRERATRMTVPVTVRIDGVVPGARFGSDLEGAAYFFVSEALANVLKHAQADRVEVRLASEHERLLVEVEDDGCGFDASRAKRSGLRGLQDRIETLGGRLELRSRPGNGTVLRMDVPTYERTSV
jgi:signal transduction histidine kinase